MTESTEERPRRLLLNVLELEGLILEVLELELVLKVLKLVLKMSDLSTEREHQLTEA